MSAAVVKDLQDLPVVLTMKQVQDLLGISKLKTYELAHKEGFPVVRLGRSLRVPRDRFVMWLNEQADARGE